MTKTYQNGVKIIININDNMMMIAPIVMGLLILRNKDRRSTSAILNVPINTKIAPNIKIAGDKYGIDI